MHVYEMKGKKGLHVLVAEKALGKILPFGAVVHHIDGNTTNHRNDNLVICPSQAYHSLLHLRQEALNSCGNANFRKCHFCQKWSTTEQLHKHGTRNSYWHKKCKANYEKGRK